MLQRGRRRGRRAGKGDGGRAVVAGPWRMHTTVLGPGDVSGAGGTPVCDVVLVHGLGMSSRSLRRTQRLLAADVRVHAPDLPGFGRSSRPSSPLTLPELADALALWIDAVGLHRPVLVGHSLGCQVIAHLADRHPERVCCLVMASPSRDPRAPRPWQQALRLLADAPREAPSLLPIAVSDYLRAGPARMWQTLRESMRTDATSRLRRLELPVLVVRGGRDPVVSAGWARRVTELVRNGELVTLPSAPHGLVHTTPAAFVGVVRPFLVEHGARHGGGGTDREAS